MYQDINISDVSRFICYPDLSYGLMCGGYATVKDRLFDITLAAHIWYKIDVLVGRHYSLPPVYGPKLMSTDVLVGLGRQIICP
ncbi:1208_t:CDS:1, partial [Gigaspora margarita]